MYPTGRAVASDGLRQNQWHRRVVKKVGRRQLGISCLVDLKNPLLFTMQNHVPP